MRLADEFGLNRTTLRFAEPDRERLFYDEYFARSLPQVRASLLIGAACLGAAYVVNGVLFEGPVLAFARALTAFLAASLLGLAVFSWTPPFRHWMRLTLVVAHLLFALFAQVLIAAADPELMAIGTLFIVILVANAFTFSRMGFTHAAGTGAGLVAVWVATLAQPGMVPPRLLVGYVALLLAGYLIMLLAGYFLELSIRREYVQRGLLAAERDRSERLLLNVLPREIAERLKQRETTIADSFDQATVLFADLVGFTGLAAQTPARELVGILNDVFVRFDAVAERHGLEKIKTIGDAYMAVAGLPTPRPDHAEAAAEMALDLLAALADLNRERGLNLGVRIGLASGPVVAGVIGRKKFAYDLWGDTVNTASRMESHGLPGQVQVTEAAAERLRVQYRLEERGPIEVKGKGLMRTAFLVGRLQAPAPAPAATRLAPGPASAGAGSALPVGT